MLCVPSTPTLPDRVARAAARAPGSTTPRTGTSKASRSAGNATADAVLQATTSISTPCATSTRPLRTEYWVTTSGDLVP